MLHEQRGVLFWRPTSTLKLFAIFDGSPLGEEALALFCVQTVGESHPELAENTDGYG